MRSWTPLPTSRASRWSWRLLDALASLQESTTDEPQAPGGPLWTVRTPAKYDRVRAPYANRIGAAASAAHVRTAGALPEHQPRNPTTPKQAVAPCGNPSPVECGPTPIRTDPSWRRAPARRSRKAPAMARTHPGPARTAQDARQIASAQARGLCFRRTTQAEAVCDRAAMRGRVLARLALSGDASLRTRFTYSDQYSAKTTPFRLR